MPKTKLQIYCAWCGKCMGTKDGKGVEGVTHGICDECKENVMEAAEKAKEPKDGCGNNS